MRHSPEHGIRHELCARSSTTFSRESVTSLLPDSERSVHRIDPPPGSFWKMISCATRDLRCGNRERNGGGKLFLIAGTECLRTSSMDEVVTTAKGGRRVNATGVGKYSYMHLINKHILSKMALLNFFSKLPLSSMLPEQHCLC